MIRRILVPLDDTSYTRTALDHACALARRSGAEVTGVAVLDIPSIARAAEPAPVGGFYYAERLEAAMEKEAKERISSLLSDFSSTCEEAGIAHREADLQGSPSGTILKEAQYYDLVMTGLRTRFHFETKDRLERSVEDLLDHSATPVYAATEQNTLPDLGSRKLRFTAAFDGSLSAVRAMHALAALDLTGVAEVGLFAGEGTEGDAACILDKAAAFLRAHGYEDVKTEWIEDDFKEQMAERFSAEADIIVLGAHSRQGLLDFLLGGLTKRLIKDARTPLLIGL